MSQQLRTRRSEALRFIRNSQPKPKQSAFRKKLKVCQQQLHFRRTKKICCNKLGLMSSVQNPLCNHFSQTRTLSCRMQRKGFLWPAELLSAYQVSYILDLVRYRCPNICSSKLLNFIFIILWAVSLSVCSRIKLRYRFININWWISLENEEKRGHSRSHCKKFFTFVI